MPGMVAHAPGAAERGGAHPISRVYGPGEWIDRYEVLGLLGRGGMAVVYAVRKRGVGGFERTLALKMMLPHLVEDGSYLAMFLDEIRIVSRIEHPNVVQVLDVGEFEGSPYMVMELLRGRSLAECLFHGPPHGIIAAWIAQIAEGLHAAHETRDSDGTWLRIVHRDVSSANVHVGADGRARVLDFGIAGAVGRLTTTQHGELKGRIAMMAPEAITRSAEVDRRADVWALGVLAFQAFSGRKLFGTDNDAETMWRVLNAPIPPLGDAAPEPLHEVIAACLVREPSKRLGTAAEVARAFRAYADREGATEHAIAKWMEATFGPELAETPVFAAAPRIAPPRGSSAAAPLEEATDTIAEAPARRRWVVATAALAGLAAIAVLGWALARGLDDGAEARDGAPAAPAAATPPAPPSEITAELASPSSPPASPAVEPSPEPSASEAPSERRVTRSRAKRRAVRSGRSEGRRTSASTTATGRLLDSPYSGGDS